MGELLSTIEAARLLGVTEATMRRWIRQGLFLPRGNGDPGGIRRAELLRWARAHGIGVAAPRRGPSPPAADLLADAVERGGVVADRDPETAAEAIEAALDAVPGLRAADRERLLEEVLDRERMASTGLGKGVALPHPRRPPGELLSEPAVGVCFPERPLDWAALDGEPVFAVLCLLSPDARVHLQLLQRVAWALRSRELTEHFRSRPSHGALVERLRSISEEA